MDSKEKVTAIEVKEIVLQLGKREIRLTDEEARALQACLNGHYGCPPVHYWYGHYQKQLQYPVVYCGDSPNTSGSIGGGSNATSGDIGLTTPSNTTTASECICTLKDAGLMEFDMHQMSA